MMVKRQLTELSNMSVLNMECVKRVWDDHYGPRSEAGKSCM